MVVCELCGRKFRSKRSLKIHIDRLHEAHRACKDFYEKTRLQFFPLLEERKWVAAERFVGQIKATELDEKWRMGYAHALMGMIAALKDETSSAQPYISEVRNYDGEKLQETQNFFKKALQREINKSFDMGYFQAWFKYIEYLLQKNKKQ